MIENEGFDKIRRNFSGVPIRRSIVFWELHVRGSTIVGTLQDRGDFDLRIALLLPVQDCSFGLKGLGFRVQGLGV